MQRMESRSPKSRFCQMCRFDPIFFLIGIFFAASTVSGQGIIPGDGFSAGWKKAGPVRTFIKQDLFNHIDGGAELYLEFGFVKLAVQPYTNGKAELGLEAYEMESPAAALGIYLIQAGRESGWPEIKARNSSEDAQIAAVKGLFFVKINNFEGGGGVKPAMIALINTVLAGVAADPSADPFAVLPLEGRIPGTERLIRGPVGLQPYFTFGEGDILGLGGKIFAVLADYREGDGSFSTRLIIDYGTPAPASAVFENLRTNLDPYLTIVETQPRSFVFRDYQRKFGRAALGERVLEIRFKLSRRPAALLPLSAF